MCVALVVNIKLLNDSKAIVRNKDDFHKDQILDELLRILGKNTWEQRLFFNITTLLDLNFRISYWY